MNLLLIVAVAVVLIVAMGQVLVSEYKAPAERHGSVPARPEPANPTER